MYANNTCILWNVHTWVINPANVVSSEVFWVHCVCFCYNVTVNIMMIVGILKTTTRRATATATVTTPQRRKSFSLVSKLYIGLCTVDLLIVLNFAIAYIIPYLDSVQSLEYQACMFTNRIWAAFTGGMVFFEQLLTLNLVISRYVASKKPISNFHQIIIKSLLVSVFACLSAGVIDYFLIAKFSTLGKKGEQIVQAMLYCVVVGGINLAMISVNIHLFRLLKRTSREQQNSTTTPTATNHKNNMHSAKTLLAISMKTMILNIPLYISPVYWIILVSTHAKREDAESALKPSVKGFMFVAYLLNVALNSQIYILRSKKIKSFYKKCIKCRGVTTKTTTSMSNSISLT